MNQQISTEHLLWLRLRAQRLVPAHAGAALSAKEIVGEVFGVQAQEINAGILGIRARGEGVGGVGILQEMRHPYTLVRTWCMRGTLHMISTADARWLIPFLRPDFIAADQRRFTQLGWNADSREKGMQLLRDRLANQGAATRNEVIQLLRENGLPFEGQAPIHLIAQAAYEGILCEGVVRENETRYVPFADWIGEPEHLPRDTALTKLATGYLAAFGPATCADFAAWSGLKITAAREAWRLITDQIAPLESEGGPVWLLKTRIPWLNERPGPLPTVRLLPGFDNYLLGYTSRSSIVPTTYEKLVHPGGGMISATLIVNGRVLGIWKTVRRRSFIEIIVQPFERLDPHTLLGIEHEVSNIGRFLEIETHLLLEPF